MDIDGLPWDTPHRPKPLFFFVGAKNRPIEFPFWSLKGWAEVNYPFTVKDCNIRPALSAPVPMVTSTCWQHASEGSDQTCQALWWVWFRFVNGFQSFATSDQWDIATPQKDPKDRNVLYNIVSVYDWYHQISAISWSYRWHIGLAIARLFCKSWLPLSERSLARGEVAWGPKLMGSCIVPSMFCPPQPFLW